MSIWTIILCNILNIMMTCKEADEISQISISFAFQFQLTLCVEFHSYIKTGKHWDLKQHWSTVTITRVLVTL